MKTSEPDFTIGIEEEYLLVDRDSLDLAEAPEALMLACQSELQDQVAPEFLKCQIEIGTKVSGPREQCANLLKLTQYLGRPLFSPNHLVP